MPITGTGTERLLFFAGASGRDPGPGRGQAIDDLEVTDLLQALQGEGAWRAQ
jgi:hypothetical protein